MRQNKRVCLHNPDVREMLSSNSHSFLNLQVTHKLRSWSLLLYILFYFIKEFTCINSMFLKRIFFIVLYFRTTQKYVNFSSHHISISPITGRYLYIGSNAPRTSGYKADLVSPSLSATSATGKCFSFWFVFSNTQTIGTLSVKVVQVCQLLGVCIST